MITDEQFALLVPELRRQGCTCAPKFLIDFDDDPDGNRGFVVHERGCPLDDG